MRDDDPDDVDYPYYVTAHEIAHQWWAHQVVGAQRARRDDDLGVDGAVLRADGDEEEVRRRRRCGASSSSSSTATCAAARRSARRSVPLARYENQLYIHYQKGSLVMYALQDFIGEERGQPRAQEVRRDGARFKGPPYTDTTRAARFLREETPPELPRT